MSNDTPEEGDEELSRDERITEVRNSRRSMSEEANGVPEDPFTAPQHFGVTGSDIGLGRSESDAETDLDACSCKTPELEIATGIVGPSRIQNLHCERCGHRFKTVIGPADEVGEDGESA